LLHRLVTREHHQVADLVNFWRGNMQLFKPKCPIDENQRLWIENSIGWLINELNEYDLLNAPVVLPNEEFFPDPYSGTQACVEKMVARVCGYMNVDVARLEVALFTDRFEKPPGLAVYGGTNRGAAGLYYPPDVGGRITLGIESSNLKDPMSLVATIAHELGHIHLLADGRLNKNNLNHELITDLLTVAFGLGIFTANSSLKFKQWDADSTHGWNVSRLGYLSQDMFAYSLAAYSWLRGDMSPRWSRYLTYNVKIYMKQSLDYIRKSGGVDISHSSRASLTDNINYNKKLGGAS
jgi:hypothetical protein